MLIRITSIPTSVKIQHKEPSDRMNHHLPVVDLFETLKTTSNHHNSSYRTSQFSFSRRYIEIVQCLASMKNPKLNIVMDIFKVEVVEDIIIEVSSP